MCSLINLLDVFVDALLYKYLSKVLSGSSDRVTGNCMLIPCSPSFITTPANFSSGCLLLKGVPGHAPAIDDWDRMLPHRTYRVNHARYQTRPTSCHCWGVLVFIPEGSGLCIHERSGANKKNSPMRGMLDGAQGPKRSTHPWNDSASIHHHRYGPPTLTLTLIRPPIYHTSQLRS